MWGFRLFLIICGKHKQQLVTFSTLANEICKVLKSERLERTRKKEKEINKCSKPTDEAVTLYCFFFLSIVTLSYVSTGCVHEASQTRRHFENSDEKRSNKPARALYCCGALLSYYLLPVIYHFY